MYITEAWDGVVAVKEVPLDQLSKLAWSFALLQATKDPGFHVVCAEILSRSSQFADLSKDPKSCGQLAQVGLRTTTVCPACHITYPHSVSCFPHYVPPLCVLLPTLCTNTSCLLLIFTYNAWRPVSIKRISAWRPAALVMYRKLVLCFPRYVPPLGTLLQKLSASDYRRASLHHVPQVCVLPPQITCRRPASCFLRYLPSRSNVFHISGTITVHPASCVPLPDSCTAVSRL